MNAFLSLWASLDTRRRLIVGGATLAMFAAILALSQMASSPQMALLYASLDPSAAGQVVAALDARGVDYVVEGEAIKVPLDLRDSLRMELAADGLPEQGGAGYELLDSLSGFGTTAQMFDAAYGRAVEGELARTILANPAIRSARVHIARPASNGLMAPDAPSASVVVTMASGSMTPDGAKALRHLVAAAVTGLRPDAVEVIDADTGLIPLADGAAPPAQAATRAAALKQNVERLLAARVGPNAAVVEVSVDVVTETEQLTEHIYDPKGRVAVSTENETKSGHETQSGGAVTVASNLPEGDAGATGGSGSQTEETREKVAYNVSETQRQVTRAAGDIRRLSVAVLVDGETVADADGTPKWQPRSDEELATLRDLVASAIGFDEARGDVLTLKSLEFRPQVEQGTLASTGWFAPLDLSGAIPAMLAALVTLAAALFVVRPALRQALTPPQPEPLALPAASMTGEISDDLHLPDLPVIGDFDITPESEDPVARLRRLIEERQAESFEILRGWMEAGGENA